MPDNKSCTRCGARVPGDSLFCEKCGEPLELPAAELQAEPSGTSWQQPIRPLANTDTPARYEPLYPPPPTQRESKLSSILPIVGSIVGLVVVLFVIINMVAPGLIPSLAPALSSTPTPAAATSSVAPTASSADIASLTTKVVQGWGYTITTPFSANTGSGTTYYTAAGLYKGYNVSFQAEQIPAGINLTSSFNNVVTALKGNGFKELSSNSTNWSGANSQSMVVDAATTTLPDGNQMIVWQFWQEK